jgi:tRNA-(ms[2]io[6]A)-hydroxylase
MEIADARTRLEQLAAEEEPLAVVLQSVPLLSASSPAWVDAALADPLALLDDHAQCELKAASNALAVVGRYPEHDILVRRMASLAREEMLHYRLVRQLLIERGGAPTRPRANPYMKGLGAERLGGEQALLDDLLVAAVIEARSCERFVVLYRGLSGRSDAADQAPLATFYERLARSESGHARIFVGLATELFEPELVRSELLRRCRIEAQVLESLEVSPRMHGGHRAV